MLRIGAHVSISGGVAKAVDRQRDLGGNCGQIFVGSPRTWSVSDVDPDDAAAFGAAVAETDVRPWIVHGTYLINFATPKADLGEKSVEAVQAELDACAELDVPYYVFHPGSHTGAGVDDGIGNIGERLSALDVPAETTLLLENTAGAGTSLGRTCEQLERMIDDAALGDDVGVCLDTCHLYAAGYDLRSETGMAELVDEVEATVGLERVRYLHLNDSKHPLGSEKDEHEHVGEGEIGERGFRNFLNHEAFRDLPMVLETPTAEKGYAWNVERVRTLYEE